MPEKISWYEPAFGESEKQKVCQVLDSGYVNEGPMTRELERSLADYLGVVHVSMTTSGTAALYLALEADRRVRELEGYETLIPDLSMIGAVAAIDRNELLARTLQLMQKYLPKVMPKLADFMNIELEKNARIVEAVGVDKAQQIDDYDIIEARPFGFGGSMRMEARADR